MTWRRIQLVTDQGETVEEVVIAPYEPAPQVLLWGSRVFIYETLGRYREAFAVSIQMTAKEYEKVATFNPATGQARDTDTAT